LGFPDRTQGESATGAPKTEAKRSAQNRSEWSRGAPKTEKSGQEERPTNKTERTSTVARWGKKLGFPDGTQGESARGAPKTEVSRQEERPTNKIQRTATEVRWGKNLGFPEGTRDSSWQEERPKPKRVAKRSAQNRSEWSRGAPNQQNRKNSDSGAVGKKLGVSRRNARRVGHRGAQNRGDEERPKPRR
jgi:hypothetical protein